MSEPLIMTSAAARILKKSITTTHAYVRDGMLRATRTANGFRLFRESDVRELARRLELRDRAESQPESID
jgi:DNA-binding transcriptional MerR regulator